ncbi:Glucose-6-phosphate isomerase, partial [Trachipleistophora hominis]
VFKYAEDFGDMVDRTLITLLDLFKNDPVRTEKFVRKVNVGDEAIYFDYSKTHIDTMLLHELNRGFRSTETRKGMFKKEELNFTEHRKVLHIALRDKNVLEAIEKNGSGDKLGEEEQLVFHELKKMRQFERKFEEGELLGVTGKKLRTVVNIGIGGSDLGPRMVTEALEFYKKDNVKVFYIANIDSTETERVFSKIDAEETLFIVVSKTFTTLETLANARLALKLMKERLNVDEREITEKHFVAVSANKEEVVNFGINNCFDMWDFVGGRFSLWSAVGLSIILYIGFTNFLSLLKGASIMDEHFKNEITEKNVPILQAYIEVYYTNFRKYESRCVVAYDEYLKNLYLYLQQLEMESNGKMATFSGSVSWNTGMVLWGGVGTSAQHSFFQLLHQGTRRVLVEFILPLQPLGDHKVMDHSHFEMLFANCVAQSQALMVGTETSNNNKYFGGNRPSITICYTKLTPAVLGALIAFYEHKVFVQGLYWRINSFDQFGVELGKSLAKKVLEYIDDEPKDVDNSTKNLIELYKSLNK